MRGQHTVVSTVLVTTIGVLLATTYYLYSQGIFFQTKSNLQRMIEEHTDLAKRYIEISSATAKIISDENSGTNIVQLMVTITNTGGSDIALYGASLYLYKNDVLVSAWPVAPVSGTCSSRLSPDVPCTFVVDIVSHDYSTPEDIYNSSIVMYINNSRKVAKVEYAGKVPGKTIYKECHSCDECSAVLSSAPPESIVVISIADPVSGNCVSISGARDVTVYCRTELVGDGTGIGILIENSNDISIRSCEIENFKYGVYVRNSRNLSFSSGYFHDNTVDLAFDPSSLEDVCTVRFADVVTTSGYVYLATGSQDTVPVLGASALWLVGTENSTFNGNGSILSRVSPAVALCHTSSVSVSSFNVRDTDVGVLLLSDRSTRLENVDVDSRGRGIYSRSSSGGYICCSTFRSPGADVFDAPSGVEWDYQTVFAGPGG